MYTIVLILSPCHLGITKDIKSYNNYNITLDPIITISTSL